MFFFRVLSGLAFSLLSLHELLTLAQRVHSVLLRTFSETPFISAQLDQLQHAIERLKKAFQMARGSKFTEMLAQADRNRDAAFQSLTGFLDGLASVKVDFELKAPAQTLLDIIGKYDRGLYRFGYTQQSASVESLIKELSEPRNMTYLEQTGAIQFFNMVVDTQKAFEDLYHSKVSEDGVKNYPDAKESAADISYRLAILLTNADSLGHDQPETYANVTAELNLAISDIMTPARARATRSENATQKPQPSEPATQPSENNQDIEPGLAPGIA